MAKETVLPLAPYPSLSIRKGLPSSQLAALNQTLTARLAETLSLPPEKRNTEASRNFVASYAQDTAIHALQALIWGDNSSSAMVEQTISTRVLILAEKLASDLSLQTLLDLSIIYASVRPAQMRSVLAIAIETNPGLSDAIDRELLPAFTLLLTSGSESGLYGARKSAYCILSFLRVSGPEVVRKFSTKAFVVALAKCYDQVMTRIATSYGGLRDGQDDWEKIWVQTKVDMVDAFHIVFTTMLRDMASKSGSALGLEAERAFDVVFALLEVPPASTASSSTTPFLNRSLLADYQQSYDLGKELASALKHAEEKDARLDILESALQELEGKEKLNDKDPGVLRLIIKSSGAPPGIDCRGRGRAQETQISSKGKERAPAAPPTDPDVELKVSQVLDIFPDLSPPYVTALLAHPPYDGNAELVISAVLEGVAPGPDELQVAAPRISSNDRPLTERRNVFDEEDLDVERVHVGKKSDAYVLQDRAFIEEMKADIIRRAEIFSDSEDDDEDARGNIVAFDEELDEVPNVKVGGDGEDSGEDDDDEEATDEPLSIDTILQLAYVRDPKLFDRDAATRRSKARADLRDQTKWADEQIEGWRIMFEKNPKKDKILQKHEFSGNQPLLPEASSSGHGGSRGGGRGQGRGRGRSGGGGRGGRGSGRGGGGGGDARARALKDKRGNQNRKRGHDKKMAKAGPPPP